VPAVNILIFLVGLVSLIKGADLFVLTSSQVARKIGVSEFIIGLTLVSVGTSVPELAAALTASFQQASGIVIGNILGSNIANIGLIASTAALLKSIKTEEFMLRRDGYIMLFSSFLLFLFMLDFRI
jgi:cation:H+ antiporter